MRNRSTEDYLKSIFALEGSGDRVTTSALAAHLRVADASITGMMKKLSKDGLVRYERYRGTRLTPSGRRAALRIVRRHRLWEMFLVEMLGYSWDRIHDEADRLEHVTSEELERKLDAALGYPSLDPHGDPIPSKDGTVKGTRDKRLSDSAPGSVVVVSRVSDQDPEVLKYAAAVGIGLRRRIRIKEAVAFDGSLRVQVGSREQFISAKLAHCIYVTRA